MRRPAAYKRHVNKLCEYFRGKVWAGEYAFDLRFVESIEGESSAVADIGIDTTYLCITLRATDALLEHFKAGRWWRVAEIICHEWCHVLTEPLYELALRGLPDGAITRKWVEEVRERQTQRICYSIMALTPKEVWHPYHKTTPKRNSPKLTPP